MGATSDRGDPPAEMPEELSPRRIGRRLVEVAIVVLLIAALVLLGPGLGSLRSRLAHASGAWLVAGVALEVVSALCYVVVFRAVFCPRMGWRMSYLIGMSEQGANSVLSVSGAGGLALGAWALRRGGMSTEHIARRTVAFFLLTSLANVATLIVFALLYPTGLLGHDPNPILVYVFGGAAAALTALVVLALPRLRPLTGPARPNAGRIARARRFARNSLGDGVRDALDMLRHRPAGILIGSFGVMGFDLAVLATCFHAFRYSPSVGVLVVGYLIGQLGGNIPIPGGIIGLDLGLIGTYALLNLPLAPTSAAVLIYHAISLWIPGLLGSEAFIELRHRLQREASPAALCIPLAEPSEVVHLPVRAGASS
jgi:uncharacterized membrane protein YbhN (UPF0104 family)